jgi:hypothetical protein
VHGYNLPSFQPHNITALAFFVVKLPVALRQFFVSLVIDNGAASFYWLVSHKQFDFPKRDAVVFFSVAQQKPDNDFFNKRWIENSKINIDSGYKITLVKLPGLNLGIE